MKQTTLSILTATLLLSPVLGAEDLGEIVVTSTNKLPQKIKNSTANVTVITAEEIAEKGYQSVPEVLAHTSGFAFASNGGAGQLSSLFVRGLSSDNLLVLIDGVPLTDYTQPNAAASLEHISLSSVAKIEVVKGGQSGIWGAGAAAGSINIITKGDKDSTNIHLKAGSHGTYGVGMDISKQFENASLSISGNLLSTEGISALAPVDAEEDRFKNKDFHIKGSMDINAYSHVTLFWHNYNGTFDFDSNNDANDTTSSGENDQTLYGIGYHYHKEALIVDARISHRTIERNLAGSGAWGPWTFDTEGSSTNYSLTSSYAFNTQQSLSIGAEHTINKAQTASAFGSSDIEFKNSALFASYTHTIEHLLGAKTTLNAVVRYDDFDKFDDKTTYRIGIKRACDAIEGLHSAANVYTGYKAPSLFQLSNARGTLKPESLKGFELSVGYKKLLKLTYFSNKITDKLDSITDPVTFMPQYFNNGNGVKTTGIELSSEIVLGESGFIAGANITHMLDFADASGKDALRIPENSANIYLDYYFDADSYVGIIANYIGKRRDSIYDPATFTPVDVTLESYTTVDLTYKTKLSPDLGLSITAKNIFDKEYETVKGYSTEGRSIYATIEYRF
jgi:vitamin B12 transporter